MRVTLCWFACEPLYCSFPISADGERAEDIRDVLNKSGEGRVHNRDLRLQPTFKCQLVFPQQVLDAVHIREDCSSVVLLALRSFATDFIRSLVEGSWSAFSVRAATVKRSRTICSKTLFLLGTLERSDVCHRHPSRGTNITAYCPPGSRGRIRHVLLARARLQLDQENDEAIRRSCHALLALQKGKMRHTMRRTFRRG